MSKHFLRQPPPFRIVKALVEAQEAAAALQAVARHLQLVHGVNVLHMHLDARPVGCLRGPHVEVLVSPCLEVEGIVAVVEIGEFREELQLLLRVQLRVWQVS